jgi:hypothetical protein
MDVDPSFIQRWISNATDLLEQVTEDLSRAESDKVRLEEEAETYHQQAISVSYKLTVMFPGHRVAQRATYL